MNLVEEKSNLRRKRAINPNQLVFLIWLKVFSVDFQIADTLNWPLSAERIIPRSVLPCAPSQ